MFLSTVMISHVGKLGMFPGMSQTAVSFSIRDFGLFSDAVGVFTLLTNSFCCGLRGGHDLGLIAWAAVSVAEVRHSSIFTLDRTHQLTE